MINNRKYVKEYKGYTILEELNYKNETTFYSIAPGKVGKDLVNAISVKYSYFNSIQEAEDFIDNLLEEEKGK